MVRGLVNFVPAVAYLFCLNLPTAFSQPCTKTFRALYYPVMLEYAPRKFKSGRADFSRAFREGRKNRRREDEEGRLTCSRLCTTRKFLSLPHDRVCNWRQKSENRVQTQICIKVKLAVSFHNCESFCRLVLSEK